MAISGGEGQIFVDLLKVHSVVFLCGGASQGFGWGIRDSDLRGKAKGLRVGIRGLRDRNRGLRSGVSSYRGRPRGFKARILLPSLGTQEQQWLSTGLRGLAWLGVQEADRFCSSNGEHLRSKGSGKAFIFHCPARLE